MSVIRPINRDARRLEFASAHPFPFIKIDNFLDPEFANEVAASYPSYEAAKSLGREFDKLNERLKIQITDSDQFPEPVRRLAEAFSSQSWLNELEYITGIPRLLADPRFDGAGLHLTGPGGRLDVHVDFNLRSDRNLFRRLNILLYLNPVWESSWGGQIELWDRDVRHCCHSFDPIFNRCVVFETSEISFHGVTPVTSPVGYVRNSFAAYYYTLEPPANWDGTQHSTIFKPRPDEALRRFALMPMASLRKRLIKAVRRGSARLTNFRGRD